MIRIISTTMLVLLAGTSGLLAQVAQEYRLQPEDIVSVRVLGEETMTVEAPIGMDGNLSIPFLGFIRAAGLTPQELELKIRNGLMPDYFVDPKVTVNILRFRSMRASVVGMAGRPGEFEFKPGDRVLSLISQAQSPIPGRADLKRATLVRRGSMEQVPLDLHAMLVRGDLSQNYVLRDGDIINIPETRLNRVSILGVVQRPGQFDWFEGMTLADAVAGAGGEVPTRSRMSRIQIQRPIPGREWEWNLFTVDFTKFTSHNDFTQNVALEPGDVIVVPPTNTPDWAQYSNIASILFTIQSLTSRNFNFFPRF